MTRCVRAGLALAALMISGTVAGAETRGGSAATPAAKPVRTQSAETTQLVQADPVSPAQPAAQNPVHPEPAAPPTAAANPAPAAAKPVAAAIPEPVKVSSDPRPTLTPDTFVATMRAADRYRQIAEAGGWPMLPVGLTLKAGDRGPTVALLRQRLAASDDLSPDAAAGDVFDAALTDALKRFQARHGLPEVGVIGARTIAALNVPAETRTRQLSASAGRLMGSKFAFGERYVMVNIPSATVEAVQGGSVVRRYVAVVGKPDRPSPTVETRVTNINFNPTWTVPVSLIKKDIIPHVRKDPNYLAKMRIHLLDAAGNDVDPAKIDWATEQAVNYTVRQDPGASNSLGEVRIDMPNRHAVYMHDTPSKRLFARNVRFESSGCVRVAGVRDLVAWLLDGTPAAAQPGTTPAAPAGGAWTPADVDGAIASGKRLDVKLAKPVPVAWVYLTGYAGPDGTVHFRDDPYHLDTPEAPAVQPGLTLDALVTGSLGRKP
jgi:murein L,D-transpeptidase YcbB/YkuD